MKKYVVISFNWNPDYMFYTPLVVWAWKKLGWDTILMFVCDPPKRPVEGTYYDLQSLILDHCPYEFEKLRVDPITEYRTGTVAQISRLYAACVFDGLIMTADVDMIPLSDYWRPSPAEKTVYGYDLTGYKEFPICYAAMTDDKWRDLMKLNSRDYNHFIKRDLDSMPNAKSDDFYTYWGVDQQLLTERLKPHNPTLINRGQYPNGYAVGRMDRGNWNYNHASFIDMHCFQQLYHKGNQDKFEKTMELLTSIWPDEDFQWFIDYTNEFRRLTGHA